MKITQKDNGEFEIIKIRDAKLEDGTIVRILDDRNKMVISIEGLQTEIDILTQERDSLSNVISDKQTLLQTLKDYQKI